MATAILTNQTTVKNCMGWTFSPLPPVGSQVGSLETTPCCLDSASKVGCKSQSFTSWDCLSRSYVGGVFIATAGTQSKERREEEEMWDDIEESSINLIENSEVRF